MEGCIPPNNPAASPQYFHVPKLGISERDDLFFGLHFILGKKLGICKRVNFAKSFPQYRKMVDFAKSSTPMLNIDLHPSS